jgi:hypothetical protein
MVALASKEELQETPLKGYAIQIESLRNRAYLKQKKRSNLGLDIEKKLSILTHIINSFDGNGMTGKVKSSPGSQV